MNLLWCVRIEEFETRLFGCRFTNNVLCTCFALLQLFVTIASFFQHIFSWLHYNHVFFCRSVVAANAPWISYYLAYDIIIFDFGLMHRILGTSECVANYLDGGYMRCSWCVQQMLALCLLLACISCIPKPAWLLWPALFMQSAYVLGLAILSMAIAPKLMDALTENVDKELAVATGIYSVGVLFNWLFTCILWHFYWGSETRQEQLRALRAL